MRAVSDEVKVFARLAIFGLVVGAAYWFLTYEDAGTALLLGFGLGSGVASIGIFLKARRGQTGAGAHGAPLPGPGWAPLGIGAGLGGVALGAAFGPWLTIAGLLVAIIGGLSWLSAAMREAASIESAPTESASTGPATGHPASVDPGSVPRAAVRPAAGDPAAVDATRPDTSGPG